MKTLRNQSQHGGVLVVTMLVCGLVGIMLVAYLSMVSGQHTFTQRSQVWNNAIPVCEAGIEESLAHINHSATIGTNFAKNGWVLSAGAYRKERTTTDSRIRMAISAAYPPTLTVTGYVRSPSQSRWISRAVRVKTSINERFPYAMLSKSKITMSGTVFIDSFNSTDPMESTLGKYDPAKRDDDATVATTSSIADYIDTGNADIYGKVGTGPGGRVKVGNGSIGDIPFVNNPANNGKIQPGHSTDDINIWIPDGSLPTPFAPTTPGAGVVPPIAGTNYAYVLGNGDYRLSQISLSGSDKVLVTGKARLHVQGQTSISGQAYILLGVGASLELYAGGDINLSGGGVVNGTGSAKNFEIIGLNSCANINYSGGAQFIGSVYAPRTNVKLSGNVDAVGAMVGNEITISGTVNFHYDEALAGDPKEGRFLAASWQEL